MSIPHIGHRCVFPLHPKAPHFFGGEKYETHRVKQCQTQHFQGEGLESRYVGTDDDL